MLVIRWLLRHPKNALGRNMTADVFGSKIIVNYQSRSWYPKYKKCIWIYKNVVYYNVKYWNPTRYAKEELCWVQYAHDLQLRALLLQGPVTGRQLQSVVQVKISLKILQKGHLSLTFFVETIFVDLQLPTPKLRE